MLPLPDVPADGDADNSDDTGDNRENDDDDDADALLCSTAFVSVLSSCLELIPRERALLATSERLLFKAKRRDRRPKRSPEHMNT